MAEPLRLKDPDNAIRALEMFIFEHINYHSGCVIELNQDVDSVLLLTLAVRSLGPERIRALTFTHERTIPHLTAAIEWAQKLGVSPTQVSLRGHHQPDVLKNLSTLDAFMAAGNFITRMKMSWLYAIANSENRLVMGSLNRSRRLLGNFTKYGDGAADVRLFGNFYRTQTLQLAKHLQLPVSIIGAPASAGFWEGQTDEKELGAGYDSLDHILYHVIDRNHSAQETSERLGVSEQLVYDVIARVESNEHKRQAPVMADLDAL